MNMRIINNATLKESYKNYLLGIGSIINLVGNLPENFIKFTIKKVDAEVARPNDIIIGKSLWLAPIDITKYYKNEEKTKEEKEVTIES
ncbi:MAG: hypothetical protein EPN82_13255 [Bacteroidetes bacterium]|nr:MAG: hypothetical protein EPN82_13255 [Bacteroidota bacterium]